MRARHPFTIEAAVILPDHLHAIWTLPEQDADFALRRRLIKSAFSHGLMRGERISTSRVSKGERGIWQRRYWEHTLRDQDDFIRHLDYIHLNPVKHGYAPRVQDWPYSSFRGLGQAWCLSRRLGGRSQYRSTLLRRKVTGLAALNPSYLLAFFAISERNGVRDCSRTGGRGRSAGA